jgi:multidrug efflux system membrane fusion protein
MVQQQDDLQAVIASGLMAAERVVTTGFGRLADGTKVEATSAEDAGQIITDPSQRPARPVGGGNPKGQGQGKGQRQQNPANAPPAAAPGAAPGAAVPGGAPAAAVPGGAPTANAPGPDATETRSPGQRRGGAPKGPEQPTQAAGGPPSPTP